MMQVSSSNAGVQFETIYYKYTKTLTAKCYSQARLAKNASRDKHGSDGELKQMYKLL